MDRRDRPGLRAVTLITGCLTLVVGILFLTVPAFARYGREWIIAVLLLCAAAMSAGFALTTLRTDVRVYTSLLTALSLVTGIIILVHPLDTFITLTTLMGVYFILESAIMGGLGMSVWPIQRASVMLFIMGGISFVMSVLIWLRLAGAPKTVIISLLGISFIARGIAYMAISLMMRGRAPLPPPSVVNPKTPEPSGA